MGSVVAGAWHVLRHVSWRGLARKRTVLVHGSGPVALSCLALCRRFGATTVVYWKCAGDRRGAPDPLRCGATRVLEASATIDDFIQLVGAVYSRVCVCVHCGVCTESFTILLGNSLDVPLFASPLHLDDQPGYCGSGHHNGRPSYRHGQCQCRDRSV